MKVFTHNFNPHSNSGPNKFTRTLFASLINNGLVKLSNQNDADVEFCLIQQQFHKQKPMILRLDGIYFNSAQDFKNQNAPIKFAYENADTVIFQSNFNKKLTESWFGPHKNGCVIHNAADSFLINSVNTDVWDDKFGKDVEVWSCASSWRPHKRLDENIRYFLEFAPKDAILAIAGKDAKVSSLTNSIQGRLVFLGELDYISLLSLYKKSSTFIHLAYLDHCPNVVVDAQAAGCKIVCSSTGGTHEVVDNGIIIIEDEWDFKPCELYNPPKMDFGNVKEIAVHRDFRDRKTNKRVTRFEQCVNSYYNVFKDVILT